MKLLGSHGKKATQVCPCGFAGDPRKACTCSPGTVAKYQRRLSGPLLDRIDLFVDVPRVEYEKLMDDAPVESSAQVRERVEAARERQQRRFQGTPYTCNAEMGPSEVSRFCPIDSAAQNLLQTAMRQLNLSARAFHRVLKVARTIADLAGEDNISVAQVAEALQYRSRGLV